MPDLPDLSAVQWSMNGHGEKVTPADCKAFSAAIYTGDEENVLNFVSSKFSLFLPFDLHSLCPWYLLLDYGHFSVIRDIINMHFKKNELVLKATLTFFVISHETDPLLERCLNLLQRINAGSSILTLSLEAINSNSMEFLDLLCRNMQHNFTIENTPISRLPLQVAMTCDNIEAVYVLLHSKMATIDDVLDANGNTILHLCDSWHILQLLMDGFDADPYATINQHGVNAVTAAIEQGNWEKYRLLESNIVVRAERLRLQPWWALPIYSQHLNVNRNRADFFEWSLARSLPYRQWAKDQEEWIVRFNGETGNDMGGLWMCWFRRLLDRVFYNGQSAQDSMENCLFVPSYNVFIPNRNLLSDLGTYRRHFLFAGILIGKSLKQGIPLHVRFPPFVYKRLLGWQLCKDDLRDDNPVAYSSLLELEKLHSQNYDIESLCLSFHSNPDLAVTDENFGEFVEDYWMHFMYGQGLRSFWRSFFAGFFKVYPGFQYPLSNYLTWTELRDILYGNSDDDFKVSEMKTHFIVDSESIPSYIRAWFWEILSSYPQAKLCELFTCITEQEHLPLGGFGNLSKPVFIGAERIGSIPRVSTCDHQLLIPVNVASKEELADAMEHLFQKEQKLFVDTSILFEDASEEEEQNYQLILRNEKAVKEQSDKRKFFNERYK